MRVDKCHLNKNMVNSKLEVIYWDVQDKSRNADVIVDDKLLIKNGIER